MDLHGINLFLSNSLSIANSKINFGRCNLRHCLKVLIILKTLGRKYFIKEFNSVIIFFSFIKVTFFTVYMF